MNQIKEVSFLGKKICFVKLPDNVDSVTVDNRDSIIRGIANSEPYESAKIPTGLKVFHGYSHNLTDEKIVELFSSEREFYRVCTENEIFYNYSAWTGEWAVLSDFESKS